MYNTDKIPFFAWQCLTIELKHRNIDLVIPNDNQMDDLLKVLVYSMNTADGNTDSADAVTKLLINYKRKQRYDFNNTNEDESR